MAGILSPRKARTKRDILRLRSTIAVGRGAWLHLAHNGRVLIVNQKFGRFTEGVVSLTRGEFEKFARFYEAGQVERIDKRKKAK